MKKKNKEAIRNALSKYAWPGGYPVYLITADGAEICPDCVKSAYAEQE